MNTKIPSYLFEKANINRLILVTTIFALLFINIYEPFGSLVLFRTISEFKYFFLSSVIILNGMMIIVLSRLLMLDFVKKHSVTYLQYSFWVLAEILGMSLFFTLFTGLDQEERLDRDFIDAFNRSVLNTCIVLLMPYTSIWLYSWLHRKKANSIPKSTLESQVVKLEDNLIVIPDEKGDMRIALLPDNLLYIDASDKFITIHYTFQERLSHLLIRNSIDKVYRILSDNSQLMRCHKDFIVNVEKVKVLHKNNDEVTIQLDDANTADIPVSKTYYDEFIARLSDYS